VRKYVNEAETILKLFQCFISVLFHCSLNNAAGGRLKRNTICDGLYGRRPGTHCQISQNPSRGVRDFRRMLQTALFTSVFMTIEMLREIALTNLLSTLAIFTGNLIRTTNLLVISTQRI